MPDAIWVDMPIGNQNRGFLIVKHRLLFTVIDSQVSKAIVCAPNEYMFPDVLVIVKLKSGNRTILLVPHNQVHIGRAKPSTPAFIGDLLDTLQLNQRVQCFVFLPRISAQ